MATRTVPGRSHPRGAPQPGSSIDLLSPAYPSVLSVEVTTRCNLKCKMCALVSGGTRSSRNPGHMEAAVWHRIIEAARGVDHVNVNGWGENFANPRFLTLLADLDRLGVPTNFSTNGTYLTPENVAHLAALRHLTHINVSIDSPDPDVFAAVRGGSLPRVLSRLGNLVAGLPRPERITVSSVVMRSTVESLVRFPELLSRIGVRNYVLQGLVDGGRRFADEVLPVGDAVSDALEQIRSGCAEHGLNLLVHPYLGHQVARREPSIWRDAPDGKVGAHSGPSSADTRQCTSPWDHIFVNKDGQVLPCCNSAVWEETSTDGQNVMGDLSSQSFAEVWHGEKFRRFRRDLLEGPMPSICRTCTVTSTGTHPLQLYAARLEPRPWWKPSQRLELIVRNSGTSTWTKKTGLHIGTSAPRDRISSWHHRSWLNANRIGTFSEEAVRPGERAHFELPVTAEEADFREVFELVVEGVCWLPNTRFRLGRRRSWDSAEKLEIQPSSPAAAGR